MALWKRRFFLFQFFLFLADTMQSVLTPAFREKCTYRQFNTVQRRIAMPSRRIRSGEGNDVTLKMPETSSLFLAKKHLPPEIIQRAGCVALIAARTDFSQVITTAR